jgi:hypothetical protein
MSERERGWPTLHEYRNLEAEVVRLREALRKYGRHLSTCGEPGTCICGFSRALGDTPDEC